MKADSNRIAPSAVIETPPRSNAENNTRDLAHGVPTPRLSRVRDTILTPRTTHYLGIPLGTPSKNPFGKNLGELQYLLIAHHDAMLDIGHEIMALNQKIRQTNKSDFKEIDILYEAKDLLDQRYLNVEKEFESAYSNMLLAIHDQIIDTKSRLGLLKTLSNHPTIPRVSETFYSQLSILINEFDILKPCFMNIKGEEDQGPALTPQAVDFIISHLKENYDELFVNADIKCISLSSLIDAIESFNLHSDENFALGLVLYDDDFINNPHFEAVFCIKDMGQTHLFVLNSTGHNVTVFRKRKSALLPKSLQILRENIPRLKKNDQSVILYSKQPKRQNGKVECSVFSVYDLKTLIEMRNQVDIVQYYRDPENSQFIEWISPQQLDNIDGNLPGMGFWSLKSFPKKLLMLTQSERAFSEISSRGSLDTCDHSVLRYNSKGKTVIKEKHLASIKHDRNQFLMIDEEGNKRVFKAQKKRFDYIINIISQALKKDDISDQYRFEPPNVSRTGIFPLLPDVDEPTEARPTKKALKPSKLLDRISNKEHDESPLEKFSPILL